MSITPWQEKQCEEEKGRLTQGQMASLRPGRPIGKGSNACVYATPDPETIVKITSDSDDAFAFARAAGLKSVPKIHNVFQLRDTDGTDSGYFAIEVEKVDTFSQSSDEAKFVSVFNDVMVAEDVHKLITPGQKNPKFKVPTKVKNKVKKTCKEAGEMDWFPLDQVGACTRMVDEAIAVYEDLGKNGIAFSDSHEGNWGRTYNGRLVAIDLGLSNAPPVDLPRLAGRGEGRKMKRRRSKGLGVVVHEGKQAAMTVWRVQNAKGEGPYRAEGVEPTEFDALEAGLPTTDRALYKFIMKGDKFSAQRKSDRDEARRILGDAIQPSPRSDFFPNEWGDLSPSATKQYKFAFPTRQAGLDWIGGRWLTELKKEGYALVEVPAKRVVLSKSGKQVIYIPWGEKYRAPRAKPTGRRQGILVRGRKLSGIDEATPEAPEGNGTGFVLGLAFLGLMVYAFTKANPTSTEKK